MTHFQSFAEEQARRHPAFKPQDAIKLCYQAAFGAEHLLHDAAPVKSYFNSEYDNTPAADLPLFEVVSADYARCNLAAWKQHALPAQWLFQMFYLTASKPAASDISDFSALLNQMDELTASHAFSFSFDEWQICRRQYEASWPAEDRPQPVHHSEDYRLAEHPAYRIVHTQYLRLIPVLKAIHSAVSRPAGLDKPFVIAIDGRAASGKSTLAALLADVLQAGLIHMDDFFLPPALRTEERLSEPGGNVHYERFALEVLPHLTSAESFSYTCFDCSQMALGAARPVAASPFRIVEGSYSCHPFFDDYMDLRLVCDVDSTEQQARILTRNGPELAQMFRERWIPMEELYFQTFSIRDHADLVINT